MVAFICYFLSIETTKPAPRQLPRRPAFARFCLVWLEGQFAVSELRDQILGADIVGQAHLEHDTFHRLPTKQMQAINDFVLPEATQSAMLDNFGKRSEERRVGKECRSRW